MISGGFPSSSASCACSNTVLYESKDVTTTLYSGCLALNSAARASANPRRGASAKAIHMSISAGSSAVGPDSPHAATSIARMASTANHLVALIILLSE